MSDLTRYRRLPGYSTVGTDNTLPPGSYSSAVADFVPDTTLQDIEDAWADVWESEKALLRNDWRQFAKVIALLDALKGDKR